MVRPVQQQEYIYIFFFNTDSTTSISSNHVFDVSIRASINWQHLLIYFFFGFIFRHSAQKCLWQQFPSAFSSYLHCLWTSMTLKLQALDLLETCPLQIQRKYIVLLILSVMFRYVQIKMKLQSQGTPDNEYFFSRSILLFFEPFQIETFIIRF